MSFWSSCSASCGNGHAIRQISCSNPSTANGALTCAGPRTEQSTCTVTSCSGESFYVAIRFMKEIYIS